jgi:hypothetical protein
MTPDERQAGALVAAGAKEARDYILAYARAAGLDPPSFLVNVAAVLVCAALAEQPEDQRLAVIRSIHNPLGLEHRLREVESEATLPPGGFAAPEARR